MRLRGLRDVLVVMDPSGAWGAAVARALLLPLERGGTLHLLCRDPAPAPESAERSVRERADAVARPDLDVVAYRAEASLWQEIGLHARSLVADLVVIGGSPKTIRRSTGTSLPRLAAVAGAPVLVATRRTEAPYVRPLLAIDFELAAVDLVHLVARVIGSATSEIAVVHAFETSLEARRVGDGLNAWSGKFFAEARRRVDEFLGAFPPIAQSWEGIVVPGPPAEAIVEVAERRDVDLVVLGTHAVEGLTLLLGGSVSRQVAERLERDLLVACPLTERVAFPPQRDHGGIWTLGP